MVTQANFWWLSKACVDRSQTTGFIESADHFPYIRTFLYEYYLETLTCKHQLFWHNYLNVLPALMAVNCETA